jgi:hypothetical protein
MNPTNEGQISLRERNGDCALVADYPETRTTELTERSFEWCTDSAAEAMQSLMNWVNASEFLIVETLFKRRS